MVGRFVAIVGVLAVLLSGCGLAQDESGGEPTRQDSRSRTASAGAERRSGLGVLGEDEGGGGGEGEAGSTTTTEAPETTTTTTTELLTEEQLEAIEAMQDGHTLCGTFDELVNAGRFLVTESPRDLTGPQYAAYADEIADLSDLTETLGPPEVQPMLADMAAAFRGFADALRGAGTTEQIQDAVTAMFGTHGPTVDAALSPISAACPSPDGLWYKVAPADWWSIVVTETEAA